MSRAAELLGLVAAVQYRRKDGGSWHTMAAFDSPDIAQSYMGECAGAQRPWEYRVIELEPSQTDPPDDICGLCGKAGADKMALWTGGGVYWPGERRPETEMVHAECEHAETARAHAALSQDQRDAVIRSASGGVWP